MKTRHKATEASHANLQNQHLVLFIECPVWFQNLKCCYAHIAAFLCETLKKAPG